MTIQQYAIIRGEYPFNEVIGMTQVKVDHKLPRDMAQAKAGSDALRQAINEFNKSPDFFSRHPVVEPIQVN